MSAFADLFVARQPALDDAFGEPILVTHRLAGQFVAGAADPDNPAFTAIGVLDVEGVIVDDAGLKTGARSEVETLKPVVDFAFAQFGPGRLAPVKGTILTATDRTGAPQFEVVSRLPDGVGRVVFQLAPLS